MVVMVVNRTGRWRSRKVERTLLLLLLLLRRSRRGRRRRRWECGTALLGEEAGHRRGRRQRKRTDRRRTAVRTRRHGQGRTQRQLMLLLLLLLLLMVLQQSRRLLELGHGGRRSCCGLGLTLATGGGRGQLGVVRRHRAVVVAGFLGVVHKVAPRAVRAEAYAVERAAQLGLVLWMTLEVAQLLHAVRKLALVAVLALTRLLERSAQLGFVSRRIDLLRQRFRLRSFELPVATSSATTPITSTATGLRRPQQLHQRFQRGRGGVGRRRRRNCRHRVGGGSRESIVDQQLAGRVLLLGVGVVVGLMVLTVVLLLRRMWLLLLVVGRHGKVLLEQNLLLAAAVGGSVVVMAGATGVGRIAAGAAVCAVRNHLRCASGVCLILQCKITKVVESPGVHYRGRHSPGSFVRSACRFLLFELFLLPLTASFCSVSRFADKRTKLLSFFLLARFASSTGFSERNFHVHIRTLTNSSSSFFAEDSMRLRLVLSENALFLPCCKE